MAVLEVKYRRIYTTEIIETTALLFTDSGHVVNIKDSLPDATHRYDEVIYNGSAYYVEVTDDGLMLEDGDFELFKDEYNKELNKFLAEYPNHYE